MRGVRKADIVMEPNWNWVMGQKLPELMKRSKICQQKWEKLHFSQVEIELPTCMSVQLNICFSKQSKNRFQRIIASRGSQPLKWPPSDSHLLLYKPVHSPLSQWIRAFLCDLQCMEEVVVCDFRGLVIKCITIVALVSCVTCLGESQPACPKFTWHDPSQQITPTWQSCEGAAWKWILQPQPNQ